MHIQKTLKQMLIASFMLCSAQMLVASAETRSLEHRLDPQWRDGGQRDVQVNAIPAVSTMSNLQLLHVNDVYPARLTRINPGKWQLATSAPRYTPTSVVDRNAALLQPITVRF